MSVANPLARSDFWQRASPRERALLALGATVVIAALLLTFVARPLLHFLADEPALRAQRVARLADAEARVAALGKPAPTRATPAPAEALGRALDAAGIARNAALVDVTSDRIALTLPATRLADVASVMAGVAREGLVVSAATLSMRAAGAESAGDARTAQAVDARGASREAQAAPGAATLRAEISFTAPR